MPTVSVIVPNYNHEIYLKQRLESIFQQSFQDFEVILLDDASTDDSSELLSLYAKHPKVNHFLINEQNTGSPFKQWNKGIELAKGQFIWIAESDDWADKNFLEKMLPLINKENVGLAFCNSFWVNQEGKKQQSLSIYKDSFLREGLKEIKEGLLFRCTIQNVSSVLFRRSVFKECGDFFMKFHSCGDWILYTQILRNYSLAYNAECLNYFRWYHDNISNRSQSEGVWLREGIKVLDLVDTSWGLSVKDQLKISKAWLTKAVFFSMKKNTWLRDGFMIFKKVLKFNIRLVFSRI